MEAMYDDLYCELFDSHEDVDVLISATKFNCESLKAKALIVYRDTIDKTEYSNELQKKFAQDVVNAEIKRCHDKMFKHCAGYTHITDEG